MSGETNDMANGELLTEVLAILREEKPIPELSAAATARLILAAQIQFQKCLKDLDGRVKNLEEGNRTNTEKDKTAVTWPFLFEKFGVPVLVTILTLVVTAAFVALTGIIQFK